MNFHLKYFTDPTSPGGCSHAPSEEKCCTPYNRCREGEGGCTSNIHCDDGYICGNIGECPGGFKDGLRCCKKDRRAPYVRCDIANNNGTAMNGLDNCCKSTNECDQFESDCDDDGDCKHGLICKQNACATGFGNDIDYDCCWKRKYPVYLLVKGPIVIFGRKLICITLTMQILGAIMRDFG